MIIVLHGVILIKLIQFVNIVFILKRFFMSSYKKIISNVYGFINRAGSYYLIDDEKSGLVLIDTGYPGSIKKLKKLLDFLGKEITDINHILITHADGDHVACLKELADKSQAKVYLSTLTKNYLIAKKTPPHFPFFINLLVQIASCFFIKAPESNFVVVSDRENINILGGVEVFFTPGHTPDHVSYWLPSLNLLFSGDTFNNFGKLDVCPMFLNHATELNIKSAKKLLKLNPSVICVGHGTDYFSVTKQPKDIQNLNIKLGNLQG